MLLRYRRSRHNERRIAEARITVRFFFQFLEGNPQMVTFITNIKFNQQGFKGTDDNSKRVAAFKAAAKKPGGKGHEHLLDIR